MKGLRPMKEKGLNTFPIGAQYYRPPNPPSQWEGDLKTASEYGLNLIQIRLMWSWHNPAPGKFDFEEIHKLLELCKKNKLKTIMLINLESAPAWLVKKHPETMYISHLGEIIYPDGAPNTACGGFPGLCFDHPVVKDKAIEYITALVSQFKGHESIYCWEPHNEPMIEPARDMDELFCYCESTIQVFRNWLKRRYKNDIRKLNEVWKRRFSEFDEIFPPRRGGSYADWIDWGRFNIDNFIEHEKWRAKAIRDIDHEHFLMLHVRGKSGLLRNPIQEGIDDWRLAQIVDKYGFSAFPQGETLDEFCLVLDVVRCASKGKDFWISELQGGPFSLGLKRDEPFFYTIISGRQIEASEKEMINPGQVTKERFNLWSWLPISYGAKGILWWQYRCEHYGQEYGFGLTNIDGTPSERLELVKEMSEVINSNLNLFSRANPCQSKVAIGFSPIISMLNYAAEGNIDLYRNSLTGLYRVLWHAGYQVDFVRLDEEAVDDNYNQYKVIYLPLPVWLSQKAVHKLKDFVKQGGTLVSEASVSQYDETFYSQQCLPVYGLDKVFGFKQKNIRSTHKVELLYRGKKLASRFYEEILSPTTAEVIGRFKKGESAVTLNKFGKGHTFYFGSNPFMEYNFSEDPYLIEIVKEINRQVTRFAYTDRKETFCRVLDAEDKKILFIFNSMDTPIVTTLTMEFENSQIIDLLTKKRIKTTKKDSSTNIRTKMEGYGTRIFLVE